MDYILKSNTQITIQGTPEEIEALEAMILGDCYVIGRPGKTALRVPKHEQLTVSPDPEMENRFGKFDGARPYKPGTRIRVGVSPDKTSWWHIYVDGVGGYGCSVEELERRYNSLKRAGFVCLRSPRGGDGTFWERWFLSGTWMAEGPIKDMNCEQIMNWLCEEITPGSIEATVQRYALTFD